MSVDERMVKSKHRSGIRQYMKDKPTKCDELKLMEPYLDRGIICIGQLVTDVFLHGTSSAGTVCKTQWERFPCILRKCTRLGYDGKAEDGLRYI